MSNPHVKVCPACRQRRSLSQYRKDRRICIFCINKDRRIARMCKQRREIQRLIEWPAPEIIATRLTR